MTDEAMRARRLRSRAQLATEDVPSSDHLPLIDAGAVAIRPVADVARRALALFAVALKSEGGEDEKVGEMVAEHRLDAVFTPAERTWIADRSDEPDEGDVTRFNWRYEAAWALLWAIGYVDALAFPDTMMNAAEAGLEVMTRPGDDFVDEAVLRDEEELLDAFDLAWCYNWAAREARVTGKPVPAGIDERITDERQHALQWLVYGDGPAWDDVRTDT